MEGVVHFSQGVHATSRPFISSPDVLHQNMMHDGWILQWWIGVHTWIGGFVMLL